MYWAVLGKHTLRSFPESRELFLQKKYEFVPLVRLDVQFQPNLSKITSIRTALTMIYATFCYFITLDIPFSKLYTFRRAPSNHIRLSSNFTRLAQLQARLLLIIILKFQFNCYSVVTRNIFCNQAFPIFCPFIFLCY